MAGQVLLLNPRRRRRKKATTSRRRRRTHARVSNPVRRRRRREQARVANPRRRRRSHRVHHRRRRLRRNPGMHFGGGGNIGKAAMIVGGMVVAEVLADKLASVLPAAWKQDADVVRIGSKAAICIGVPMVLKVVKVIPAPIANAVALGGLIITGWDIFKTYVAPKIGLQMSEYAPGQITGMDESAYDGVANYEAGVLTGTGQSAYGDGAYGG